MSLMHEDDSAHERIVKNYDEEPGKVYDLYWLDSK